MNLLHRLAAATLVAVPFSPAALARANFPEVEPNGTKAEATSAMPMNGGDTISGSSTGVTTTVGDVAMTSADTFLIETAPQATPGWYEWTLTLSAGHTAILRGLAQTGLPGTVGVPTAGSDVTVATSSPTFGNILRWYANENPSRVYVRVTGTGASPSFYSGTLTVVAAPNVIVVPGTFTAGAITLSTVGQTIVDTDIAVADSSRSVLPGHQNDDEGLGGPTFQSRLTRNYAAGTYYAVLSRFDLSTTNPHPADDDFEGGEVMDFPNCVVNGASQSPSDLDFTLDDGTGPVAISAGNTAAYQIVFAEFTVSGGNLTSFCFGDGGDQLGCTACPCSNNAAQGSLGGCRNSNGTSARLVPSGNPDISGAQDTLHFDVLAANVTTFGVLTSGDNRLPNNPANPCFTQNPGSGVQSALLDGLRCIGANVVRHGSRPTDANGDIGVTTNGWGPPNNPLAGIGVTSGFLAGQTRHFQVFYRENPASSCMTGQATTQGVTVTFQ